MLLEMYGLFGQQTCKHTRIFVHFPYVQLQYL